MATSSSDMGKIIFNLLSAKDKEPEPSEHLTFYLQEGIFVLFWSFIHVFMYKAVNNAYIKPIDITIKGSKSIKQDDWFKMTQRKGKFWSTAKMITIFVPCSLS